MISGESPAFSGHPFIFAMADITAADTKVPESAAALPGAASGLDATAATLSPVVAGPVPSAGKLRVLVVHPDRVLFEGETGYLVAPGRQGDLGIMPGHTPLFAELVKGEIHLLGEKEEIVAIEGGIIKVRGDSVTVLADV